MSRFSFRHHYLPQFYIKGFTNTDGLLYFFDKKYKTIKKSPIGTNGIFFEEGVNNILINGELNSELESEYYARIDNHFSKLISKIKLNLDADDLFSESNRIGINLFVISLFWRNPVTDFAAFDLVQRANVSFLTSDNKFVNDKKKEDNLKNDITFIKLKRADLLFETISQMIENTNQQVFYKEVEFPRPSFLIGDFPIIFDKLGNSFNELYYCDYVFPLNSTKLIYRTKKELKPATIENITPINLAMIHQAVRYVASPDYNFLKLMVDLYVLVKDSGKLQNEIDKIFDFKV